MRAHEFITEDQKRRPEISLRHLNQLKHINRARAASHARQAALKRVMYASPAREHEQIELEKARLELEQQKAELAATKAERLAHHCREGIRRAGRGVRYQRQWQLMARNGPDSP